MSETKTLQERLRGVAEKFAVIHEERNRENTDVMVDEEVVFNACCHLDEAADALDAKDALLREAREVLKRSGTFALDQNALTLGLAIGTILFKIDEAQK